MNQMPPSPDEAGDTLRAGTPECRRALAFIDEQVPALRDELQQLADLNSGSFNASGVNAVATRLAGRFAPLGGAAEWIDVAPYRYTDDRGEWRERALGRALRIRHRPEAPLRVFSAAISIRCSASTIIFRQREQPAMTCSTVPVWPTSRVACW